MRAALAFAIALSVSAPAMAQTAGGHDSRHPATAAPAAASSATEGEVRRIDLDAQKMTIRHGPIPNLDMPPMTMVFRVTDPAMLEKVKAGDKVRFKADKINGAYTVTAIEPAN